MSILVDTSILIGYFKGQSGGRFELFDEMIDRRIPFGINHFIYQEVLQGAKGQVEFKQLNDYLMALPFYELRYGRKSFENAALMYMNCRRRGVTIRSTIDLLIAETAIENDLYLLHNDSDYVYISQVISELKLY